MKPKKRKIRLLRNLCGPIALAIENATLYDETRKEAARSQTLAGIASSLNTRLELDDVLKSICEAVAGLLNTDAAIITLPDETGENFAYKSGYGIPEWFGEKFKPFPKKSWTSITNTSGYFIIEDITSLKGSINYDLYCMSGLRSVLGVSVCYHQQLIGCLFVVSISNSRVFSPEDIESLKGIADLGAQAINNAKMFEALRNSRENLRALSRQLVEVQEAERRSLALELHDELGQLLNSVKLSLDMIPLLPVETRADKTRQAGEAIGDLIGRVRQMSLQLRPSTLDDLGLLPTLEYLFNSYQAKTNAQVTFTYKDIETRFPPAVEITAYRIIQEALTNVIRHVNEKNIEVDIWTDSTHLLIRISDHGPGFNVKTTLQGHRSTGISGMRERARLIGGELVIHSELEKGTIIAASLPLSSN